jgi:hypothetical protein
MEEEEDEYNDGVDPPAYERILLNFDDEHLFRFYRDDTDSIRHINNLPLDKRAQKPEIKQVECVSSVVVVAKTIDTASRVSPQIQ